MADAHFEPQLHPQYTTSNMDSKPFLPKSRRVVGQCPTCQQSFASRYELRAHMSDPVTHSPVPDSDAISFGELSDCDSFDESPLPTQPPIDEHEPALDTDGFEFSKAMPNLEHDGFELFDDGEQEFPSPHINAEKGGIHTIPDNSGDAQPTAEYAPIEMPPRKPRQVRGGALGVLYCGTCDKFFGNETVFKRHFMFGAKHGDEPRDLRELYYRVWGSSWKDEARRQEGRVQEVEEMEM